MIIISRKIDFDIRIVVYKIYLNIDFLKSHDYEVVY
jgi:hypothetical protein